MNVLATVRYTISIRAGFEFGGSSGIPYAARYKVCIESAARHVLEAAILNKWCLKVKLSAMIKSRSKRDLTHVLGRMFVVVVDDGTVMASAVVMNL